MEPASLRRLASLAMIAIMAMLFLYLFASKQVTDTETPRIAQFTHDVLERNLAKDTKVTLKLRSLAAGGVGHYELRLAPATRIQGDPAAVETLLTSAARTVFEEIGGRRRGATLTCIADLPGGARRVTYDQTMQKIPEPAVQSEPSESDAE